MARGIWNGSSPRASGEDQKPKRPKPGRLMAGLRSSIPITARGDRSRTPRRMACNLEPQRNPEAKKCSLNTPTEVGSVSKHAYWVHHPPLPAPIVGSSGTSTVPVPRIEPTAARRKRSMLISMRTVRFAIAPKFLGRRQAQRNGSLAIQWQPRGTPKLTKTSKPTNEQCFHQLGPI